MIKTIVFKKIGTFTYVAKISTNLILLSEDIYIFPLAQCKRMLNFSIAEVQIDYI